jgi:methanogenic corrinoid protein MtbC1
LTGLSVDVLRVWERRYGAVDPPRSEGGSRLYSDADIARMRKLRQAVEMGYAIGQVARLPESELDTLSSKHQGAFPTSEDADDPHEVTIHRFLAAIGGFDMVAADEEINRAATLYPPRVLIKHIVAPLLTEIGDRWAHRDFGIAHEHAATNLIRNLLSSLFRLYPPDETSDTIVLATTAGERHEFGILLSALMAATRGWRVVYLGADLPAEEIVRTVRIVKSRVLALSIVSSDNGRTYNELASIAQGLPKNARVWVGGAHADKYSELIQEADWNLVRDLEELDDRLRR